MNKKKIIITIVLIILIILIGVIITKNVNKSPEIATIEEFKYYNYIDNGKMGVIDSKGQVIINAEYNAIRIPNPEKDLFIVIYDYNSENGIYKTKVLNAKNEELFKEYEEVSSIEIKEIVSNVPFEKTVLKYKKDGKYGIMDFSGKVITKPIYEEIESMPYKEGELIAKKNGKYGVINIDGKKIIDFKYDEINSDSYYSKEKEYSLGGYIVGIKKEEGFRYGYISNKRKKILETEYNKIYRMTQIEDDKNIYLVAEQNGQAGLLKNKKKILNYEYQSIDYESLNKVFIVQKGQNYGVVDIQGKTIVEASYSDLTIEGIYIYANKGNQTEVFDIEGNKQEIPKYKTITPTKNENYNITIDSNNKYGVTDKQGNVIIPNNYYYAEYISGDYFIVSGIEGKSGIIDVKNETILSIKYDIVQKIEDFNIIQTGIVEENLLELYNGNMKKILSMENGRIVEEQTYIKVFSDKETRYFLKDGTEIKNTELFTANKLFAIERNGKWGFADKQGNIKVEPIYDKVSDFNTNGFAAICKDKKWGSIDTEGKIVIEPTYIFSERISEPNFIGKYYKVVAGYGEIYYTDEVTKAENRQ